MDLSLFLAKLLGLYLLITAVIWLVRKKQFESSTKEMFSSSGSLALSAVFCLLFGLFIAIDHSIWEWSWRGLITLIGYIIILKGIMRLAFPAQVQKMASKMFSRCCWLCFFITVIVGIYLTYNGFTQ